MMKSLVVCTVLITLFVISTDAHRKVALCGACKAIIGEIDYAIKQVDPKKTIDIGGRETRAVKYAGSETHLIEVLENVCSEMNNYALSEDENGKQTYVRFNSRAGESVTLSNVRIDSSTMQELTDACKYVVSKYDDDVIDFYTSKERDIEMQLCTNLSGFCKEKKPKREL